ncbi:MAG: transporter substrate-binding domain-containing protein [Actinomycetota bacterium]
MRRRMMAIATLAVVALVAGACGGAEESPPAATPTGTPSPTFTTLQDGTLRVASCLDYAPFETIENGEETGFDVELTEEVAKRLGLTVQWVKTDFEASFTALAGDQYDMIAAAITATGDLGTERDQIVDFSDFYFNSRQSLAVNTTKTPDIASTDDLKSGDTVGVGKGFTGKDWAEQNLAPKGIKLRAYTSITDAFRDLEAGNLTGIVNDGPSSDGIVKDLSAVEVVEYIDTNEKYAFAFSPSNPGLREAWNEQLADVIADGTYTTIFQKWFPGATVPDEFAAQ